MNLLNYVENAETSEFFPTPAHIVEKMLDGIDWSNVTTILEPSAGKGDIVKGILYKLFLRRDSRVEHVESVDCIEADGNLRQILKYTFGGEYTKKLEAEQNDIINKYPNGAYSRGREGYVYYDYDKREYVRIARNDEARVREIARELSEEHYKEEKVRVVHDDFLTFKTYKRYDLIVMNPPFSNGDKHLLKALELIKHGGAVVCLLNAETIKNPHTRTRQALIEKLEELDYSVEFIDSGFARAERKTDVETALIRVSVPQEQNLYSDIYERMKKAEGVEEADYAEVTDLTLADYIKATISMYNTEVAAGIELIKQYKALKPYISSSFNEEEVKDYLGHTCTTLLLTCGDKYEVTENEYIVKVRQKYWRALLNNEKFVAPLTTAVRERYYAKLDDLAGYDFTEFNITALISEMNSLIKSGVEEEAEKMYDRLTEAHSYYPEFQKNIHYYDGWRTNKAHKIDKKVILPCYGVFDSWNGRPRVYQATDLLTDLEKVLNYFDGNMTADVDMRRILSDHFDRGETKNIPLKFFNVTFYKKGTVHIEFTCPKLIERYNIYIAKNRRWLPPSYGVKGYKDMNDEEKAVIDSFQGEKQYNEVLRGSDYYLAPITEDKPLMLDILSDIA